MVDEIGILIMNLFTLEIDMGIIATLFFLYVLCNKSYMSRMGFFFFVFFYVIVWLVYIPNIGLRLFCSLFYCTVLLIIVLKIHYKKKQAKSEILNI